MCWFICITCHYRVQSTHILPLDLYITPQSNSSSFSKVFPSTCIHYLILIVYGLVYPLTTFNIIIGYPHFLFIFTSISSTFWEHCWSCKNFPFNFSGIFYDDRVEITHFSICFNLFESYMLRVYHFPIMSFSKFVDNNHASRDVIWAIVLHNWLLCEFPIKDCINHYLLALQRVPNLIGGRFVDSQSLSSVDVLNPVSAENLYVPSDLFMPLFVANSPWSIAGYTTSGCSSSFVD